MRMRWDSTPEWGHQNTPVLVQGRVWPMNVTESILIGIKIEKKGNVKMDLLACLGSERMASIEQAYFKAVPGSRGIQNPVKHCSIALVGIHEHFIYGLDLEE